MYPDNPKFYRHRGHRDISIREFAKAQADLEKAAQLIKGSGTRSSPTRAESGGQAAQHAAVQHLVSPRAVALPAGELCEGLRRVGRVHEGVEQRRFDRRGRRLDVDDADAPQSQGGSGKCSQAGTRSDFIAAEADLRRMK
ncbi:MAG: hypothetical protein K2Y23_21825 [Cyanobacteria bacterium]|nr:hypothetical protein [Cyanobacteriota bacterium]